MPALVLILFIASDAVLKSYFQIPFQPFFIALLIACSFYFLYYFRKNRQGEILWDELTSPSARTKNTVWLVTAIVVLGCILRFWKLGSLFDGMTYDEAYKGLDAIAIRHFGERPVFLDWNGGREALVAYAVAAAQWIFDYTNVSVRAVTALAGSISVLLFYLFTRTIFQHHIALISSFLLAISKWHIIHSRYGVRAGLYPAFEIGTLYFLSRGLNSDKKRTGSLILAGVIGALGLYTYIAYRIFPLIVLAFVLERVVRPKLRQNTKALIAAGIVAVLIVAPMATFYFEHRDSLTDRMKRTQVWRQPGRDKEGPVALVLESAAKTMGVFTYKGDAIARHNVDQEPMLSPFLTAFFIFGFLLVVFSFRRRYARFLLIYFFLTLLPGILSVGAPNVPRVFGSLPVAIIFVAFGLSAAARVLQLAGQRLPRVLVLIALSGALVTGIVDSFVRFPAILDSLTPRVAALWGMDRDQYNVARLANALGNRCEVYLTPQFFFHSTVEYLTYSKSRHHLITPRTDLRSNGSNKIIVIILQPEQVNPWWLRDDEGKRFYKWWQQVYGIEPREMHAAIRRTYDPPFTKATDGRIIRMIEENYPQAKQLRFENFNVFILRLYPN